MRTDVDMFSNFFSGKKYGKRFDRKYSRLLGGDKFHNPSTLFRGVKFEAIRQYNGIEKRNSEYNDYKFSFIYIPVMIKTMYFDNKVYFVKNDTFKFIVGIVFVNSMLGIYDHNLFGGDIDYFNKGFIYAACKDIIRPNTVGKYRYDLSLIIDSDIDNNSVTESYDDFWRKKINNPNDNIFHMLTYNSQHIAIPNNNLNFLFISFLP
jgi:hypothetical protein